MRSKLMTGIAAAAAAVVLFPFNAVAASWKETPGMYAVFETNQGKIVPPSFSRNQYGWLDAITGAKIATRKMAATM